MFGSNLITDSDFCSFRSQVKSSQCWNWNLPYHKFWEVSRSLKVTPRKIFALLYISFWKVQLAWRWSCNCGSSWKLHRRTGIFLIICLRLENFESECRIIAVKGQIELRECLLLLGAQYFVFILLSKNINFKVHRNVFFFFVGLHLSKLGLWYLDWLCLRKGCWGEYYGLRGTR